MTNNCDLDSWADIWCFFIYFFPLCFSTTPDVRRAIEGNGFNITLTSQRIPLKTCKIPSFGLTLFNKALIWLIRYVYRYQICLMGMQYLSPSWYLIYAEMHRAHWIRASDSFITPNEQFHSNTMAIRNYIRWNECERNVPGITFHQVFKK
jgi:hypothetical protein